MKNWDINELYIADGERLIAPPSASIRTGDFESERRAGSGSGRLAGNFLKYRYFGTSAIRIRTGQDFEVQRPSHLFLQAEERGDVIDLHVIPVAEGMLV